MIMRNINLFLLICVFLSSCNEERYSCNPEIDAWVKENKTDIQLMTRSDWLELDPSVQRAAFVAFTTQQKVDFWKNRFEEALNLDWNQEEKEHILRLYDRLQDSPEWFEMEKSEKVWTDFECYMFEWMDIAEEQLGWDKYQLYMLVASGERFKDKYTLEGEMDTVVVTEPRIATRSESGGDLGGRRIIKKKKRT